MQGGKDGFGEGIKVFVSRTSGEGADSWTRSASLSQGPSRHDPPPAQGCCGRLRDQACTYCEETSLHGVKYVHRETGWKRCYWVVIMLCLAGIAAYLIHGVIHDFLTRPTLISIDTTEYPIHKIPFPALTICNLNKINIKSLPPDQNKVFGRTVFTNETEWLQRVIAVLDMVYADSCSEGGCHHGPYIAQHFSTDQVQKILQLTAPSCEEMMFSCSWRGFDVPCSELFKTQHTDFGYCCIFNSVYDKSEEDNVRYTGAGDTNGLTVMIDARRYEYALSQFLSVGFKLLVHGTHDEPEVRERGMAIQPGQEIFVAVGAEQTFTTARAEVGFTPQKRNCYKEHEVKLKFSDTSIYTLANCLLSHETEALFDECGCVAYYMPGNGEMCHEKEMPCLRNFTRIGVDSTRPESSTSLLNMGVMGAAYNQMGNRLFVLAVHERETLQHFGIDDLDRLSKDFDLSAHFWDNCLPACDETKYWTELSSSQFPSRELIRNDAFRHIFETIVTRICLALGPFSPELWNQVMKPAQCELILAGRANKLLTNETTAASLYSLAVDYAQDNMAKLHFYFKTNAGTRYKRDVVYTTDQLIANIGGLLGLFMGFSIVSVFELFYFFVLNFKSSPKGAQCVSPSSKPSAN